MLRPRITLRRMMILVVILSLPIAFLAYRYRAGQEAARATAKALLHQAAVTRSLETEYLQQASKATNPASASQLKATAASLHYQSEVSQKAAMEILDSYGMK